MDSLASRIDAYLHELLDVRAPMEPVPTAQLPPFVTSRYLVMRSRLLDEHLYLCLDNSGAHLTPAAISSQMALLERQLGQMCVYVAPSIDAFNRKRLIRRHTQFVVPHNQLFLPRLGLDLREHFRQRAPEEVQALSPSAQAVVLMCILRGPGMLGKPSDLAEHLQFSRMTATRVVRELCATGLAQARSRGRERHIEWMHRGRALWAVAKSLLRTPVKRRFRVLRSHPGLPAGLDAGLTALAGYSQLAAGVMAIRAIPAAFAGAFTVADARGPRDGSEDMIELEVWHYDPRALVPSDAAVVDPLSLYLSLSDASDERVRSALDEMLDAIEW